MRTYRFRFMAEGEFSCGTPGELATEMHLRLRQLERQRLPLVGHLRLDVRCKDGWVPVGFVVWPAFRCYLFLPDLCLLWWEVAMRQRPAGSEDEITTKDTKNTKGSQSILSSSDF